jgi:hypothetical protein
LAGNHFKHHWNNKKTQCGTHVPRDGNNLYVSDRQGFKKCRVADEMDSGEDEKEVWNDSSERVNVSNKCEINDGNCEDTEAEIDDRNGEHSQPDEA